MIKLNNQTLLIICTVLIVVILGLVIVLLKKNNNVSCGQNKQFPKQEIVLNVNKNTQRKIKLYKIPDNGYLEKFSNLTKPGPDYSSCPKEILDVFSLKKHNYTQMSELLHKVKDRPQSGINERDIDLELNSPDEIGKLITVVVPDNFKNVFKPENSTLKCDKK